MNLKNCYLDGDLYTDECLRNVWEDIGCLLKGWNDPMNLTLEEKNGLQMLNIE